MERGTSPCDCLANFMYALLNRTAVSNYRSTIHPLRCLRMLQVYQMRLNQMDRPMTMLTQGFFTTI
jgi:hypothetical protein